MSQNIFPIDFEEKNTMAQNDYILFSDSQDCNKLKKAQYCNLKGEKGDQGVPGAAATVAAGSTTTLPAGCCASVSNSGTCCAAIFNFSIPKGDKGDTGDPGTAATVCVGSTTTGAAGTCACVTNTGTSTAAVLDFVIPKGDKGDTGATGCTGPTGPSICAAAFNGNDIDFTDTAGCVTTLCDAKLCLKGDKGDTGCTGSAATITVGTTTTLASGCCATVNNSGSCSAAVFNFGIPKGDKGDTGATGNGIACVTASKAGKVTTVTICETNGCSCAFCVCDGEDGQGAGDVLGPASSTNNHVVLFDGTTGKLIKDSGALLPPVYNSLSCSSTTAALSAKQGCVLNACYTCINNKIPSAATSTNQLADKDYVNDSINSVTAYYITKNAQGDQFATYAELAAATTFYSGGVARTPTRNDYTIVLADENHDNATTRYIYNTGWEYQYTVNETALTCAQLNALNSGITSAKVACYDTIPVVTDNCQLANGCGYTTCTGTISNCSGIISALGYTPYNSSNPNGYTSCTGTLTAETVVSGDTGCTYTVKVSNTAPGAGTPSTTITFVTA